MIDEKVLIERLEEEMNDAKNLWDEDDYYTGKANAYESAIEIVNQLAEERNNGWIPCSERLPSKRDWYLVMFKEHDSDFVLVPRVADYLGKQTPFTTEEGWLILDMEDNMNYYYKKLVCIAWMPLPAPYKGEQK